MTRGQRIKERRTELGIEVVELAKKAGMAASTLYDFERGDTDNTTKLPKLAEALGLCYRWADSGKGPRLLLENDSNVQVGPSPREANLAPVTGRVRGGDGGYIYEEERPVGDGDEFVEYRGRDANAFGLRVIGDSMSPRYNHGEYIVACPNLPYSVGKYVYVAFDDGRKMVKRLSAEYPDAFRLESIHPDHPAITVMKSDITAVYVVQGPFDSDAIVHR